MIRVLAWLMVLTTGSLALSAPSLQAASPEAPVQSFAAPCSHPSDLAWDGRDLWVADWSRAMIYRSRFLL